MLPWRWCFRRSLRSVIQSSLHVCGTTFGNRQIKKINSFLQARIILMWEYYCWGFKHWIKRTQEQPKYLVQPKIKNTKRPTDFARTDFLTEAKAVVNNGYFGLLVVGVRLKEEYVYTKFYFVLHTMNIVIAGLCKNKFIIENN